ncbi:MAG: transposase [Microcystis aeruginosa W13-15]|nr:transposase [Microcystis aeruginosa W13-15]
MRIAGYGAAAQQKCLAHLLRHFKQVEKLKTPQQKELAQVFLDLITEAFRQHRQSHFETILRCFSDLEIR